MIYLDNAATSHPKPPEVVEAVRHFMVHVGANPGRSGHRLSAQAARIVFDTRQSLAELLGVSDSRQIVFTSNATAGLNIALHGMLGPRDHVVTTSMEHNSVMRTLQHLEQERGVRITVVQADQQGRVDPAAIREALEPKTRLVAINHGSNVVGTIQPIAQIKEAIGKVPLLVDAAQTAGSYPFSIERDGVDLLAFSGHKSLLGPQGIGGLYVHPGLDLPPLVRGGTGSRSESDRQPDFLPDKYESGTLNTCGIAGLGAGVRFILDQGVETIHNREMELLEVFWEGLRRIAGVVLYGPNSVEARLPTVSLNVRGKSPSQVGGLLDKSHDIMVRVGLHCAPDAHRTIGTFPDGTVRFSAGALNTTDEMEQAVAAVEEIARS